MSFSIPHFGPAAQTVEQRTLVLERMRRSLPQLAKNTSPHATQLYARYVAGELAWLQVRQELDTAASTKTRSY